MNLRTKIATVALTGVMVVGGASTAFAGRGRPTDPPAQVDDACIIYLTGGDQPTTSTWNYLGEWTNNMGMVIGGRYLIPCPAGVAPGTEINRPAHNRPARPKPAPAATTPARRHPVTGAETALFAVGGSLLAAAGSTVAVAKRRSR